MMLDDHGQLAISRRGLFLLAGSSLASWRSAYGFGKEFWETKDAAEWNSDDIARLLTKSPWAKSTSAESVKTKKDPMASTTTTPNTMPGTRSSRNQTGMGRMPGGSGKNRTPATKTVTTYKGFVVWESAAPVRAALKTKLPDGFEGQYVLGVNGVALAKSDSKSALDRVRQVTTLHTKAMPQALEASSVQEDTSNGTVYLFGFSREALALTKDEKEVVFTTHMGKLAFTAKFSPKEMLYHGELAL